MSTQPRSVHVNIPTDANYDATARGALANLQEGAPFQVVFPSFKQHEANVSLLRSAFIAAFAFLGYRYAFASTTASIRRQILIPTEFVLDGYSVLEPDAPGDRKQLAVSFDGDGNWFLLVLMGWHIVALPGLKQDPASLYQELRARSPDNRLRVRADLVGWPTAMEMHLDALKA